ncbi:S-adenosylmethionine:tRNA ribosyltransferase-isomerase [Draconibacterium orientale]|uniref:S-adenosylmethionine tRNA ribosyltransferase n=1 Tax=Draconibacterium orientale TaxID=1168034 RepID=X5DUL7_9BACT|nr:S-adenosylmethionine:tRNA ribosyltransferase-isomerase [Draconibacterium orientale]AHW58865.1 S-adenosylmethionine tRNA ribosyltransferase [Draconibacterium orientale]SET93166.1 S-adenosylmethionine:tRNA ribosyltransferase-isomerase [Draconibacterium orientale]
MNRYKDIKISDYTYNLPDERIAKYPLNERDKSKLLIRQNGTIQQDIFENCANYLPEDAQLVFNNTRVIHARLFFHKETGAKIEIFCLEPVEPADYQVAFQETEEVTWKCMVGNSKKWKEGFLTQTFEIDGKTIELTAAKIGQEGNSFHIRFVWNGGVHFSEIIEHIGQLPIPPYLNRDTEESDEETYQTVYAKIDGSVAAPTAGLHFTDPVIAQLAEKNITTNEITLHVGAGTFQPVKSETIEGHTMHHEQVIIPIEILRSFLENPKNIIAVGTTSVRSLESLYWIGLQLEEKRFDPFHPEVKQWEPYTNEATISLEKALQNIIYFLAENDEKAIRFSTQIIILPGYDFKLISGMFTNFHQPQSTLLLLISAFLGNDWKKIYDYALANDFRFLSYGDSNLYLK